MEFLPELLKFKDGTQVTSENWAERREEIVDILRREQYGYSPQKPEKVTGTVIEEDKNVLAGHGIHERISISFDTEKGEFSFPINFVYPANKKNSPLFILVNFRPELFDKYYPLEEIIDNGFAIAVIYYQDVTSDDGDFTNGLAGMYSRNDPDTDWGKISMWAWSASRVLDYLETREEIDKNNVAIIGHSRLGKTALWCSAQDERFKLACSNDSGCSGAAYERIKHGRSETVEAITRVFPFWFCGNFKKYVGREDERPFDQHFLLAASCPRYVAVDSASLDEWADPYSEQLSCIGASPAWRLLGKKGFIGKEEPVNVGESFNEGDISYYLRDGSHYLSRQDWLKYMEFFKKIM